MLANSMDSWVSIFIKNHQVILQLPRAFIWESWCGEPGLLISLRRFYALEQH